MQTQICMQKKLKKEISKYLKEIILLLPGDSGSKRKYISGLKEDIYDFAADNESVTIRDIVLHFGEKEEIAKQYMDTLDIKAVKRKLSIKRVVSAILIITLIVWSVAVFFGSVKSNNDMQEGYFISGQFIEEKDYEIV